MEPHHKKNTEDNNIHHDSSSKNSTIHASENFTHRTAEDDDLPLALKKIYRALNSAMYTLHIIATKEKTNLREYYSTHHSTENSAPAQNTKNFQVR